MDLADGQFEIDGYTFGGIWDSMKIRDNAVTVPESTWTDQDTENQFRPGLLMGQDLLRPGEWVFELHSDTYSMDEAKAAVGTMAAKWLRGGERTPSSLSVIRYRMGSQTRRVYGRGRQYAPAFDKWSYGGVVPVLASFQMSDPFYYSDDERYVDLFYTPPVTGGLKAPLKAPLTAAGTGATVRGGYIESVGGTAPTPVVIELYGPTRFATITGNGWAVQYAKPIAYDEVVTIDCRFGYALASNNFGQIVNGNLSWRTNLAKARLTPGSETLGYTGYDLTGLSRARVRWRPAYHTF